MTGGGLRPPSTVAFSAVRQRPEVLELFLAALFAQGIEVWVYDDNTDPESSALCRRAQVVLPPLEGLPAGTYRRAEDSHRWDPEAVRRVAAIKNHAIARFCETDYEALFLIDSDVLVPPGAIEHLVSADLPVLAAVYWTQWYPDLGPLPNVFPITSPLLSDLQRPGHHRVDGLGAATLIRREVFERARFSEVPHLATEGEDRWFCWLCLKAGIPLVVCTHLEAFHVYRDSQLEEARQWLGRWRAPDWPAELV